MFVTTITTRGTIDIPVGAYLDVDQAVSDRITCNGAKKRVLGGIVCTYGLAIGGL